MVIHHKLKTTQANEKPCEWKWRASESGQKRRQKNFAHFRSNSFPLDRSIQLMLGIWERHFSCRPFCLTQHRTCWSEVCLSALCVVLCQNNNGKCMTRNFTSVSTDRTLCFSWLPESMRKVRKCFFDRISNPLERKTLYVPPPLQKFVSIWPLVISVTLRGGGMDIFWNHSFDLLYSTKSLIVYTFMTNTNVCSSCIINKNITCYLICSIFITCLISFFSDLHTDCFNWKWCLMPVTTLLQWPNLRCFKITGTLNRYIYVKVMF